MDRNIGLEALKKCLENEGFELVATFNNELTDTQAYLAKNIDGEDASAAKTAVLAFRGTEKKAKDWITNFSIGNVRMVDGNREFQVHKGFYEAFKSSQKDIETHLTPLIEAGYKLYITGHSLGGALAVMATHQIGRKDVAFSPGYGARKDLIFGSEIGPDVLCACYTFGAPRVAGVGFAQSIKTPIYRIVNANDAVPRVPPVYIPWILLQVQKLIRFFPPLNAAYIGFFSFLSTVGSYCGKTVSSFLVQLRDLLKISTRFIHHGDLRYICPETVNKEVTILSSPDFGIRLFFFFSGIQNLFADHTLETEYIPKLSDYTSQRNLKSEDKPEG